MKLQKIPLLAVILLWGLSDCAMAHGGGGGGGGRGGGGGGFGGGRGGGFGGGGRVGGVSAVGARSFAVSGSRGFAVAGPRGFAVAGQRGFIAGRNFGRPFIGNRFVNRGRFGRRFNNNVNVIGFGGYPYYYPPYGYGYPPYYDNTSYDPYAGYPTDYPNGYPAYNAPEPVAAYEPYTPGAKGDVVANIQRILKTKGFYRGPVDGLSGPSTRAAIRAYDAAAGLPVTGIIDVPLLSSLRLM